MITVNEQKCEHCGACTTVCPTKSVTIGLVDLILTLNIDIGTCKNCGKCVIVCPMRALKKERSDN